MKEKNMNLKLHYEERLEELRSENKELQQQLEHLRLEKFKTSID